MLRDEGKDKGLANQEQERVIYTYSVSSVISTPWALPQPENHSKEHDATPWLTHV